jgi:hypothetical protein
MQHPLQLVINTSVAAVGCAVCCRGTGREVAADERAAAAHLLMAAPVDECLQLAYPDVYDLAEAGGSWGTEEHGQVSSGSSARTTVHECTLSIWPRARLLWISEVCRRAHAFLGDTSPRGCVHGLQAKGARRAGRRRAQHGRGGGVSLLSCMMSHLCAGKQCAGCVRRARELRSGLTWRSAAHALWGQGCQHSGMDMLTCYMCMAGVVLAYVPARRSCRVCMFNHAVTSMFDGLEMHDAMCTVLLAVHVCVWAGFCNRSGRKGVLVLGCAQ